MTTPDAKSLAADALLGTWKMRSWTVENLETGLRQDAVGPDPCGYITYASGRVNVLVVARDRVRPAALVPTDAEKLALYDTLFAYGGRYEFDGRKVVHHIDICWNEAWRGTSQVRYVHADGDTLTYVSVPARSPLTGADCVHTVVFDRVR